MRVPFTISQDAITVFAGGKFLNVLSGSTNFDKLSDHLRGDDHDVETITRLADREEFVRTSVSGSNVTVKHGEVYYKGEVVRNSLTNKLLGLLDTGFDAQPWIKFLDKIMDNPSFRSRNCLFDFLDHFNAPITPEGNFIAFKRIRQDWKDIHSGTYDNSVGKVIKMERSQVDDDPQHTCSSGLHVCADSYLDGFANAYESRTIVVEVNPADVVAVPYDYNFAKMRVCEYKVLAEIEPSEISDVLEDGYYEYDYESEYDGEEEDY